MGRNGKRPSTFTQMVELINSNVGNTLTANQILLGTTPNCRRAETNYLYKFIKLGYLEAQGLKTMDPIAKYKVLKSFPEGYTSVTFMKELRVLNNKS